METVQDLLRPCLAWRVENDWLPIWDDEREREGGGGIVLLRSVGIVDLVARDAIVSKAARVLRRENIRKGFVQTPSSHYSSSL